METGMIPEQILEGETGTIHYSYYLPENYDPQVEYPLMIVMPGYDMMWFGEESSGSNLNWDGFLCWTRRRRPSSSGSSTLTGRCASMAANTVLNYLPRKSFCPSLRVCLLL